VHLTIRVFIKAVALPGLPLAGQLVGPVLGRRVRQHRLAVYMFADGRRPRTMCAARNGCGGASVLL